MPMTHDEAAEHIEAWAIGALDAEETRALEAHMDGCAICPPIIDAMRETASEVALTAPLRRAGPALRARVLASVTGSSSASAARQPRAGRYWAATAAASIAIAAGFAGLGIYSQSKMSDLRDERAQLRTDATSQAHQFATVSTQLIMTSDMNQDLAATSDAVTEIVSQPDAARLSLTSTRMAPSSSGRYVWSRSAGLGSLVARGLPPLDEGKKYCLWIVYENDWVSGGLFSVDEDGTGRLIVRGIDADDDAGSLKGFSVTVEDDAEVVTHEGDTMLEATIPR